MSEATMEFVQKLFKAFDMHDQSTMLDLVHPDVDFASLIVEVEGGFHGHDGLRLYLRELFSTFPDIRIEAMEVHPVGDGTVVRVRVRASGVASGASTDLTDWQALTLRAGKADWWGFFRTEAEARAAIKARAGSGAS